MGQMILDKAIQLSVIARLKLTRELGENKKNIDALGGGAIDSMKRLKLSKRSLEIRAELGAGKPKEAEVTQPTPAAIDPVASEPVKKSIGKRQKDNNAAVEALRKVKAGEADANDPLIREALKGYSGSGGGLTSAQGTNGSPHEYYTPEPVAKAMWDMLDGLGFTGGKVLDPSAGMGVFARTKPDSVAVEQIELDPYSGEINGLLNDSDTVSTKVSSFEEIAANTDDETFDAVVTNVPFGDKAMRGAHWRKDKKYQNANLQEYFILRGLEKIKPGGFAAFIVPPSVVGGKGAKAVKLRNAISMASEFVGAYRMPNMVFDEAGADTITDIIILHKHSKDNQLKIDELAQQDAAKLAESNVMWSDFVEGNYFKTDGKRFQIGETTTGKGKFGEVEKVAYTGTISSVAALLKPFPKASRINWELLDATETMPIVYSEGDIVFSGGATLQMVDGKLVAVDGGLTNDDIEASGILAKFTSPLDAINQKLTLDDAVRALENERNLGRINDVPRWIISAERAALGQSADKSEWFSAVMAGMAVQEFAQSGNKEAVNYDELYPELSKVLARVQGYSNKRAGIGGELVSDALKSIAIARKKGAFTAWWRGDVAKDKNVVLTENQAYEKAKIESEDDTGFISADVLKSQFTDFDPLNDDTWCVSPDGKGVMSADDYYFGNYADFLKRAEMELQDATDPAVKEKLLRQHAKAQERITIIDTSRMKFSLETAFISIEDKAEFVKQYISTEITLNEDAKGNKVFKYSGSAPGSYASVAEIRRIKTLRRFAIYLNSNKISTQSKSEDIEDDPQEEKALLNSIKDMVQSSTAQFDAWAKSNEDIVNGIKKRLNDPENLSFTEVPNFAPVDIPNWNEAWVPHGYQYAAVRRFSKRFSGILGFDVGLGKTLSALASVQYAQGIGAKKKTMFVVPNAVLTNWKKETEKAYKDTSDCLFVGLRPNKNGVMKYDSGAVAEDLNVLRENRHAKIFVTYDVLTRIPLRDDTLDAYKDYLLANDDSFSKAIEEGKKEKTRDKIAGESAVAAALESGDKAQGIPYFEDMGIDSLVLDEAHNGKNSKKFSSEFVQAKFVANPTVSQRGMDMQAKCWYVRGMTKNNDGIMALTATPVTNSPLEIYAMLTLAIGEKDMNAMCGCTGADSFMQNTCDIEDRDEDTITGTPRSQRTLKGIANLDILRRVLDASAMIETAESVAAKGIIIEVPESEESAEYIELPIKDTSELIRMKTVYEDARKAKDGSPQASAFNLIRNMNKLITDRELYEGKFKFAFASKEKAKAEIVVAAFNKLNITEERKAHELSDDIDVNSLKSKVVTDKATGDDVVIYSVPVNVTIEKNKIVLPATDYDTHDKFMKQVDKAGLLISAEASPKIKAMLDNIKKENASPRWKPAKQIIFCDELALHHKLKLLIASETGIPASKISIVNAKSVSPDQMQDVQDGFNANEDDNRYQIVIGNKKIEVGVNLQQGTQALHHLTIGWTPDSIHQRNGRGVRQGNRVETPIMIYHYEANGTFDAYKRRLVSVKGDWIDSLMDKDQEHVTIEGDLSKEDYERMVALVGDSAAMAQFNSDMSKKAKEQASNAAKIAQVNSLSVKAGREKWLESYELDGRGFTLWLKNKQAAITDIAKQIGVLSERLSKTESALMADRCTKKIEELQAKQGAIKSIIEGVEIPSWSNINAADFPDTPAAINWNKDVAINKKMLAEAQSAFDARVTQGYGKTAVENLDNGNAIISNGKIVSDGDFVVVDGAPGIVTMQTKSWNAPVNMQFVSIENGSITINSLNGLTISKHGIVGSEARSEILQLLVELDEASIAKGVGTEGLFARFSSEVRGALRSVIPSLWESTTNNAWVAAPNFPLLMPQGLEGEFLQSIIAKQAEFVEYKTEGYREQFRFKNAKFQGEPRSQTAFEAISQWMIANNATMTMDEVRELSRRMSSLTNALYLQTIEALPAIIEKASNITELDSALVAYVNATHPWISGMNDAETIIGEFNLEVAMKKARVKLDDGSVKYDAVIPAGDFRQSGVSTDLANMIEAHFAGGVMNKELMEYANATGGTIKSSQIDTRGGAELLIAFDQELFNAVGGKLENGLVDMSASPMINEIRSKLNLGKGAIVKLDPEYITGVSHAADSAVRAYAAKKAQDALDIDVDGLVAAIQAHADINTAIVSMVDYVKLSDRFTGSFNYKAGTYLRVDMRYGSTLQKNISDKTIGLDGRVFDKNAKDWLISLSPANFSDGKPVADITAFAKFANIDSTQFKKG